MRSKISTKNQLTLYHPCTNRCYKWKWSYFSRYDGKCVSDEKDLSELINDGPKSKKFRDLIIWITDEIRVLANIEEKVTPQCDEIYKNL